MKPRWLTFAPLLMVIAVSRGATTTTPPLPAVSGDGIHQMETIYVTAVWTNMKVRMVYLDSAGGRKLSTIRIEEVRRKSAAERAGLTAGMEIVELEGVRITGLYDDEFERLLHKPLGEVLTLKVTGMRRYLSPRPYLIRIPLPRAQAGPVAAAVPGPPGVAPSPGKNE